MSGINGVYENIIGASDEQTALRYWAELGYRPLIEGRLSRDAAYTLYGVDSALRSIRLQNGSSDTHGHVRLMLWEKPPIAGLGRVRPMTIGSRWFASRTADIVRLRDAYMDAIRAGESWLVSDLIRNIITQGQEANGFYDRFRGVREMLVLGEETRHVYFQRYGYDVPGYGTIHDQSPLAVSEGTHSSIVIPDLAHLDFYTEVMGLRQEQQIDAPPATPDPRPDVTMFGNSDGLSVLMRREGEIYRYATFVTPTENVGRLYIFQPQDNSPNLQSRARPGVTGLCLLTYKVSDIEEYSRCIAESAAQNQTTIQANEFGEPAFCFDAPDGTAWGLVGS